MAKDKEPTPASAEHAQAVHNDEQRPGEGDAASNEQPKGDIPTEAPFAGDEQPKGDIPTTTVDAETVEERIDANIEEKTEPVAILETVIEKTEAHQTEAHQIPTHTTDLLAYDPTDVKTGFIPKKKRPGGFLRLEKLEQAAVGMYLNCKMDKTIVWKNEWTFTTRDHLYTLLDGKSLVPDDVMDVFVMLTIESLSKVPYPFKVPAAITRPLALVLAKSEHTGEQALTMVGDAVQRFRDVELIMLPIINHRHFHLVVLDKRKNEYIHYSSMQNPAYDTDAKEMRTLFDNALAIELGCNETTAYPLNHNRSCPQQKEDSLDCPIYVMRFIEQLLYDEKLRLPCTDVPLLRLRYTARILMDGMKRGCRESKEE